MTGKILDLRDYDRVEFVPCKGKYWFNRENYRPIPINTEVFVVDDYGKMSQYALIEEYNSDTFHSGEFITTALCGDDVERFYSLFYLQMWLEWQYDEGYLFQDSKTEDSETIESFILPLIHHGVAVSSKVLAFMEKPLTLELLRETFPDKSYSEYPWNKTESDPENN